MYDPFIFENFIKELNFRCVPHQGGLGDDSEGNSRAGGPPCSVDGALPLRELNAGALDNGGCRREISLNEDSNSERSLDWPYAAH